jgi:DNA-3-methyladenine glycosylase II
LSEQKVSRLNGVARAALDGLLDVGRLREMGPELALTDVQQLGGIGPFYASLIVIRASGFVDVLPTQEPRLRALVGQLYGLDPAPTAGELTELAEAWRPMRSWAAVLIRAAALRVLAGKTDGQAW